MIKIYYILFNERTTFFVLYCKQALIIAPNWLLILKQSLSSLTEKINLIQFNPSLCKVYGQNVILENNFWCQLPDLRFRKDFSDQADESE